jgi:hypothetical protein
MAKLVLTNAQILVNNVDLSGFSNSLELNYEVEAVEVTSFGTNRSFVGGLQNNTLTVEFMQDFAATEVEATVFPLVGTTTIVKVLPVKGTAISATNPQYVLTGTYLASHTPVAATVGELAMTSLTFTGGTLTKLTSPPA